MSREVYWYYLVPEDFNQENDDISLGCFFEEEELANTVVALLNNPDLEKMTQLAIRNTSLSLDATEYHRDQLVAALKDMLKGGYKTNETLLQYDALVKRGKNE